MAKSSHKTRVLGSPDAHAGHCSPPEKPRVFHKPFGACQRKHHWLDLVSCIYNHPGVGFPECSIIVPLDILDKCWQPYLLQDSDHDDFIYIHTWENNGKYVCVREPKTPHCCGNASEFTRAVFSQNLGGLAGGCCYSYDPRVVDPWFARDPQPSGHNASYLGRRENHLPFQSMSREAWEHENWCDYCDYIRLTFD